MPIVALCSGGFDSVTMAHELRKNHPNTEIHLLFFGYGQRNYCQEHECVFNLAQKLHCRLHCMSIPKLSWTKSNFYGEDYKDAKTQYLEYRNLIFLSYALSLAQSVGATEVYTAILKSHWGYADTSHEFLTLINSLSSLQGIKVIAPYKDLDKDDLLETAYEVGVESGEWFSCDTPIGGKPCGSCLDCQSLEGFDEYLSLTPQRVMNSRNIML